VENSVFFLKILHTIDMWRAWYICIGTTYTHYNMHAIFYIVTGQHFGVTYLNPIMPKTGLVNFTSNQLGRYFQLDLRKNDDLFDEKFVILKRKNGKSEIIDDQWNDTGCYYHSFSPHVAALDVCNGLVNPTEISTLLFVILLSLSRGAFSSQTRMSFMP